jgi:N-acetylneuraminic acid mutarotase
MGVASLGNALYVIAGSTENGHSVLDSVERYDPEHNEWTEVASLPSPRAGLSAAVDMKIVYAIGGISAKKEYSAPSTITAIDAYDPVANKWSCVTNLCTSRCEFGIGVL